MFVYKSKRWCAKPSQGLSGGILSTWLVGVRPISFTFIGSSFVGISINAQDTVIYIVNVFAPCSITAKRSLWEELKVLKQNYTKGEWCIDGDFNAITNEAERKRRSGCSSLQEISDFNNFIAGIELFDVPVSGKKFSYFSSDGISMSRLDRFLVTEGLIDLWGVSGQWIAEIYLITVLSGSSVLWKTGVLNHFVFLMGGLSMRILYPIREVVGPNFHFEGTRLLS